MHELPVTKSIFQIVLKHAERSQVSRVLSVNLEIGSLSDLQTEWVQRYFDHLSRSTIVEGAQLRIHKVPAVFRCRNCQQRFEIMSLLAEDLACKHCQSKDITMVSGREYHVRSMEAQ